MPDTQTICRKFVLTAYHHMQSAYGMQQMRTVVMRNLVSFAWHYDIMVGLDVNFDTLE